MDSLKIRKYLIFLFNLLPAIIFFVFVGFAYNEILSVSIYFIIAIFLGIILNPFVNLLEKKLNFSKNFSIFIIFSFILFLMYFSIKLIIPKIITELIHFEENFINYQFPFLLSKYKEFIGKYLPFIETPPDLEKYIAGYMSRLLSKTSKIVINFIAFISETFIVFIITFFLLRDGRYLRDLFIRLLPNNLFEVSFSVFYKIEIQLEHYVRAQFFRAIIMVILSVLFLKLIFTPYSVVLGTFMGIINIVPFIGPIIGGIPVIFVIIINYGFDIHLFYALLIIGFIRILDDGILQPVLIANSVNQHPIIVIFTVLLGGKIGGIIGMLFAIPLISILQIVYSEIKKSINYIIES